MNMEIIVTSLMVILLVAQIFLAVKQIKKGAPDGKILLTINIIVLIIWTPICILSLVLKNGVLTTIWYVITTLYMLFTVWYTNNLTKSMK